MGWYDAIFDNRDMAAVDPFGYGMGLAIGYIIIPVMLAALAVVITWQLIQKRRSADDQERQRR